VIYSMIDVHYYLSDWTPVNRKNCDWYNAVGGNFFPLPGRYILPFNEGRYVIDGDSTVTFQARRSAEWYRHPLVALTNAHTSINYGWYQHVQASGNPKNFRLYKFAPTGYNTECSIQSTWLLRQLEYLKGAKSI